MQTRARLTLFRQLLMVLVLGLVTSANGEDAGLWPSLLDAPSLTLFRALTNHETQIRYSVATSGQAQIQSSSNLLNWDTLATFPPSSSVLFIDSGAPYAARRFYRGVDTPLTNSLAGDNISTTNGDIIIHPINHATFVMSWNGQVIYFDPVGGAAPFAGMPKPNLIFVTDIHTDHMDASTLSAVGAVNAKLIVPQSVRDMLPANLQAVCQVMTNGQSIKINGMSVDALPMYNTTAGRILYHTPGRGNGYVLGMSNRRIYVSGDTEDIPEMLALKNIDVAFVCMNLPYTMDIPQAAGAVRKFRPKMVYPYHYSGSDVNQFKTLVGNDAGVEVRLRTWY